MVKKKHSQKFAPLLQELGDDHRFIIESTDLDKLLYVLIIFTCHMSHHSAPVDPRFYKIRYGLRSKTGQIVASMRRLQVLYPKLSWADGKLSLLNSVTYAGVGRLEEEEEIEIEKEREKRRKKNKPVLLPFTGADEMVTFWNNIASSTPGMSQVVTLSDKRKESLRTRLKSPFFVENWRPAISKIAKSSFCTGHNDRGWKADFEWLIENDNNIVKVMEGKYDNKPLSEKNFVDRELERLGIYEGDGYRK
jgi:hypothetical protein